MTSISPTPVSIEGAGQGEANRPSDRDGGRVVSGQGNLTGVEENGSSGVREKKADTVGARVHQSYDALRPS